MLMRPHDRGVDGMFLVGRRSQARECFERGVPHTELAPAREANKHRVPIAVSFGHVAPRRARAQNPENAVDRSPLFRDSRTAFATIGKQWIENAPFRVHQIAPTQSCPPSGKAALNHWLMKKLSTRPSTLSTEPGAVQLTTTHPS